MQAETFFLDSYGAPTTTIRLLFVTVAGVSLVLVLAAVPRVLAVTPMLCRETAKVFLLQRD